MGPHKRNSKDSLRISLKRKIIFGALPKMGRLIFFNFPIQIKKEVVM